MSEAVLIQILIGVQALLLALIGIFAPIMVRRLGHVRKDASETKEQVVNHHKSNMREDMDKHSDTLNHVRGDLTRFMTSTTHMMHDLLELGTENRRRIISLEDTEISERKRT